MNQWLLTALYNSAIGVGGKKCRMKGSGKEGEKMR
jgi:hypothetical protein